MSAIISHISKKKLSADTAYRGDYLRRELVALIKEDYPDFNDECYIDADELNQYRKKYLTRLIASETQDLDDLEKEVLDAISSHTILTENIELEIEKELTLGQKMADVIAGFGGSWIFIGIFFAFVFGWMVLNISFLFTKPFDPYPFILLNLILSCLAAIQAPIIMMSQNRLEDKDRKRGEHDYKVNLKAELEIRLLNEKIDHLILQQSKKLLTIQELQTDYLEDILKSLHSSDKAKK